MMVHEESLECEDDFRKEFERVNANFLKLDSETTNLINEIKSKNKIINVLQSDSEALLAQLQSQNLKLTILRERI